MSELKLSLEFLRSRFLAGLERRIAKLRVLLDSFSEGPEDRMAIESLNLEFHGLAGIGGTFGFHEITWVARKGELASRSVSKHEDPITAEQRRNIRTAVEELAMAASALVAPG
jgi:hypothetical protein